MESSLSQRLRRSPPDVVYTPINVTSGKTVVEQFERTFKVRFDKRKVDDLGAHIYCGDLLGKRFIGWSAFLSNSRMNRSQVAELVRLVGEVRREGCP